MKTTSSDPHLLVGLDAPDDAAVYEVAPGVAIVQTVDFFTPIVDDPYAWGRIAAANALSDVYAMGAKPLTALSLIAWPRSLGMEILGRVLDGAAEACEEAGVSIVGGHSIDDPEPKYGLAVTGTVSPSKIVRKGPAPPGVDLVLTKPLGMGIVSSGIKEGTTSPATVQQASRIMGALNRGAAEAMVEIGPVAATDVTGFGLVGHLLQMLDENVSAQLYFDAIPMLSEAVELAEQGVFPGGSRRNQEAMAKLVDTGGLSEPKAKVLFDAQTSGGLLIAVDRAKTADLLAALKAKGVEEAAKIGEVVAGAGTIRVTAS